MGGLTTRQLETRRIRSNRRGRTQRSPGEKLQNRYEIIGVIGVGGFSTVYKARDMHFANVTRLCAVKEMVINTSDPSLREMTIKSFEREANILATLKHPSIPEVYDFFTDGDRSYLVLEFIRGKDLEAVLSESENPLEQDDVIKWALQVCDVLKYLHSHKPKPIMFRDVKPSNIMLDVHEHVYLIDFNIAKVFQGVEKHTMVGTEGYSPPEQYRGEASEAGDIYALGASLHHLLTKQDPRMEVPFSFSERPIRKVNQNVSREFEELVMRCLEYQATERFHDVEALRQRLEKILAPHKFGTQISIRSQFNNRDVPSPSESYPIVENIENTVIPLWKFKCEDEVRSSPSVIENMLFVGAYDNNLYALKSQSGEFVWKFPSQDGIAGKPETYKQNIFFGSIDRNLYALQSLTGRVKWKVSTKGPIFSSPRARFDHVFFGSDDGNLYAVNVNHGRIAWKYNAQQAIRSSPYIGEEYIYVGSEGGYLFCINLSGQMKWQFNAKRAITSSPVIAEGLVFTGSQDNIVYALDAKTGWAVWNFRTNRPIISSPIIHEETLYVGSADGYLYAIDINSGRQKWNYKTEGQIASSPAIWHDAIYFGSTDKHVYSLDLKKGSLRWEFTTGGIVVSSPTTANGIVYIGSADHYIYALPA